MVRPADSFCRTRLTSEGTQVLGGHCCRQVNRPGVRGRHRCLPSADDERFEDGQHGCQTSDGLATWDTTRASLSDSAVSG
jgi:hypothetical protein